MAKKHPKALMPNNEDILKLEGIKKDFLFFLANTPDYIYFKDKQHRFTYTSDAFAKITGHVNWQALIGKSDFDIFPIEHAEAYFEKEKTVITDGKALLAIEEPYYNQQGKLCWVSSSKQPILDESGNIIGLFGISRDITKIKALEHALSERAHIDSLTKVASRLHLLEQAENLLNLAKRNKQELALFYIDLDGFKRINDQYGHHGGDTALISVATKLSQRLRGSDIVGRIGGDEFVVISFTNCEKDMLIEFATQLVALIEQPTPFNGTQLNCSCSIGIASFPKDADTVQHLMKRADQAMYLAKNNPETNSVIYQENA